jgi:hypothetical protein
MKPVRTNKVSQNRKNEQKKKGKKEEKQQYGMKMEGN